MKTRNRLLAVLLAAIMLFACSGLAFATGTPYSVTVIQTTGGNAVASTASCPAGTVVTLNATAISGYRFTGWSVMGAAVENKNDHVTTFVMPAGNVTVSANFAKEYIVTVGTEGGGIVEYTPQYPIAGERVTVTATPNDGYTFFDWSSSSVSFAAPNYYVTTFTMPASNVNIKATFYLKDNASTTPSTPAPIAPAPQSGTFSDVKSSDWFYNDVNYVFEKSLMTGTSAKLFSPKAPLTRAMLVTVLYRLAGSPAVSGNSGFSDVAQGSWYANAVIWAKENRIVNGVSTAKFAPNNAISREQIATILYRYAQYKYYYTSVSGDSNIMSYEDFYSLSSYAYDGVHWACGNGFISGNNGYLKPQSNATRAEVAAILHRFCDKYES